MKYRGVAHIATPLHFSYRALYSKSIVPCTLNRKHQEEFYVPTLICDILFPKK